MDPAPRWWMALAVCLALLVVPLGAMIWLGSAEPPLPEAPPPLAQGEPVPQDPPEEVPAARTQRAPRADAVPPLAAEEEPEPALAEEQEPGSIAGRVVDERGFALARFELAVESFRSASGERSPGRLRQVVDDGDGRFALEGLPAGSYVLVVSAEARPPALSERIEVASGQQVRGIRIVASAGGVLEGVVRDEESGEPIAGARIALDLASRSLGSSASTTSDERGAYRLEGVPEQPFSVRAAAEGYLTRVVSQISAPAGRSVKQDIGLRAADGEASTEYAGIGAVLSVDDAGIVLGRVFEEGPAAEAGLQAGDRLIGVDGEDASGWTVAQAVQRLRGPERSRVSVRIARAGREIEVVVTRDRFVR